jgi:pimeloyl-ACP methyl ester carboxylesterase
MKDNALRASALPQGGARQAAQLISQNGQAADWEFHLVGHSAGSILLAPFAQLLGGKTIADGPLAGETGYGLPLKTAALWAPGITSDLFRRTYLSLLRQNALGKLGLYTLSDEAERKDTLRRVYGKSILYFVSNALEELPRWDAGDGCSIVGMARFADRDPEIAQCVAEGRIRRVISHLTEHLAFSRDAATLAQTIAEME